MTLCPRGEALFHVKPYAPARRVPSSSRLRPRAVGWALVLLALALVAAACRGTSSPRGWAGPVVADDLILAAVDHDRLSAFRLTDQQPAWEFPGPGDEEIDLEGIYATPVVVGGVVYLGAYDGWVYALDLATGQLRWRAQTDGPIIGSVLVEGGVVYVGSSDGYLYALDAQTGQQVWQPFATKGSIWSTPVAAGGTLYVASMDRRLYAIDMATGQPRWPQPFRAAAGIPSTPAVAQGLVLVGTMDRKFYALDAQTGQVRWAFKADNWFWSEPLVVGDTVYAGALDGRVYALDISSGQPRWSQPFQARAPVRAAPVMAEGVLVVADKDGNIYGLDPATGLQAWSGKLEGSVLADPYKAGPWVYLTVGKGGLYKVEGDRGRAVPVPLGK